MNRTKRSGPLLLVLATVALAGCGGQNDTRPAKWSYLSTAIIQPSCATANCHSNLSQRSGVVLDDIKVGYGQLLSRHFVLPSRPNESSLVALIKGQGSRRMPPDFPLAQDDIDLISTWISNGAPWDGPGVAPFDVTSTATTDAGAGN